MTASGSTEAEFIAAFTAAKVVWCFRFVLQELGFPQEGPTEIHIDNQAALQTTNGNQAALQTINDNQAPTIGKRHLDIQSLSLQDWREKESISMVHVAGVLNPSDDLTKPLAHCLHARHCRRMTGHGN